MSEFEAVADLAGNVTLRLSKMVRQLHAIPWISGHLPAAAYSGLVSFSRNRSVLRLSRGSKMLRL